MEPTFSIIIVGIILVTFCVSLINLYARVMRGGLSRKDARREAELEREYYEKFNKMQIAEQKDLQKLQKLQKEHHEKLIKSKENKFNNEESIVCRIKYTQHEDTLSTEPFQIRPLGIQIETVKSKDIKDPNRDLCKNVFPNAYLEIPDQQMELEHQHQMLNYQIHNYLYTKNKERKISINLN